MKGFLLENPECHDGLEVDAACTSSVPLNGFFKGDPIKKTSYKTGREVTAATDLIHGILQADLIYPFTNKVLNVATEGACEVTASGEINVNDFVALDSSHPRKFTAVELDPAGTTYRQVFRALSPAVDDGDKFIIDLESQMATI